jgi:hypothetical protein
LLVRQDGTSVTVTFEDPAGRHDARTFALEAGSTPVEHEVALVAMNVARDQTAAFLTTPSAPAPPAPGPVAPSSSPPPAQPGPNLAVAQSPCALLRGSGQRHTPLGIDFVPYAGTSSYDRQSIRGVSIGALGALSGGVQGVAASGLVNAETGQVCGAEIAGLVNVAAGFEGLQIGGITNVASGDSSGLQVGLVDVAARNLDGGQIGLVSVAQDTNFQMGLVNVASDADFQLGLVNVDLHGRLAIDAWSKPEAGTVLLALKHGPAHFHSLYILEMNVATGRPWAAFGLGAHLTPSKRVSVDVDLVQHVQLVGTSTAPNELSEIRVLLGYALSAHVRAFAGPTYNVIEAPDPARADAPGYASVLANQGQSSYRGWPGAALGMELQ